MTQDNVLMLPAVLELSQGAALKSELAAAMLIDAGQVQRVTSPVLQLLAAAVAAGARFTAASEALREAAQTLGLTAALNLPGDENV